MKSINKKQTSELVTVFTPTYDRTLGLREMIESVLSQTYDNIELLVVDDSPDNTFKEIFDEYKSRGNIKYFHREKKLGLASAFNFCIENMNGVWLKPIGPDDLLVPNAIETFVSYAHKNNAKLLYPDIKYIDEHGKNMGSRTHQNFFNADIISNIWWYQVIMDAALFYHKSCFDIVGKYDENLIESFSYKWHLQALLLHDYTVQHIPEMLYKFRLHKKQISQLNSQTHIDDVKNIRQEISQQMEIKRSEIWKTMSTQLAKYPKNYVPLSPLTHLPIIDKELSIDIRKFKCKICQHFSGNTNYVSLPSDQNISACNNCHTIFTRDELQNNS